MNKEQLISEMLLLPATAIDYHLSQQLLQLFPDKAFIESEGYFNIEGYAKAQQCMLTRKTYSYNQMNTYWQGPEPQLLHPHHLGMQMGGVMVNGMNPFPAFTAPPMHNAASETQDAVNKAWFEVQWQGHTLDVLVLHVQGEAFQHSHFWLLADTEAIARSFLAAVCRWDAEIRGEVLVFDNGCWYKDEYLFQDIQNATLENLILRGSLKQEILDDLVQFFASRTLYEEHDVPWKRGILFVGPAGNGKTHTVKALINSMEQPCLYVKSFRAPHTQGADEFNIRQVFDRARRTAPCVLVLEDLDSLLTPQNRSFFLNELDGFASNIGIVTLATTNHPERLDPSILDRPSRFDRKYPFELPELPERSAYIMMWNESLKSSLRLTEEGAVKISELTDGFSFAYLKELFLSSKMRWIAHPQQGTMEQVMSEQVGKLREQMLSMNMLPASEIPEELQGMPPMFGPMMARSMRFQQRSQS
jgi:ATPase family associated with various cellular activities (AAA)